MKPTFSNEPHTTRETHHAGRNDDSGWFYEDRRGIQVYIGAQREGEDPRARSVLIPARALRRWAEIDAAQSKS